MSNNSSPNSSDNSFRTQLVDLLELISHDAEYDSELPRRSYIEKIYSQQINNLCKEFEELESLLPSLQVTLENYKNLAACNNIKSFGN